jgi:FtsP/CotA-like multicopper oxidase with cupredoxin domain
VTRIAVRWAPTDLPTTASAADLHFPFDPSDLVGYVWHCHIIDHEDNEMMRRDAVTLNPYAPAPASRPLVKGTNY